MKKENKKLSLLAFKEKASIRSDKHLDRIVGGIMGSCHCVVNVYGPYNNGGTVYAVTYTICVN